MYLWHAHEIVYDAPHNHDEADSADYGENRVEHFPRQESELSASNIQEVKKEACQKRGTREKLCYSIVRIKIPGCLTPLFVLDLLTTARIDLCLDLRLELYFDLCL